MTVMGTTYTEKKEAGQAIIAAFESLKDLSDKVELGEYRGFPMTLWVSDSGLSPKLQITLKHPRSGRTIPLYFKVSPEEKEIIDKKMELLGTHNQRAYLRKMAVDGYVVRVDMTDVKELAALLRTCSNNLNQIARRVNSTGNLYEEDIADLKTRYGELWGAFSSLLSKFEDL